MTGADSKNLLISLHIPKTGGQTFQHILKALAPDGLFLDYGDRPLGPGASERRIKSHREHAARLWILHERQQRGGVKTVVHGHFLSGKYRAFFPEALFLCWFREPVDRVCSHYAYWWRNSRELRGVPDDEKPGILEFANRVTARNVQSRFLNGASLASFDFVGLTGEFDRSLELLGSCLGVPIPTIEARNQNQRRDPQGYALDRDTLARIQELNAQDMALYTRVQARFSELWEARGGPS